MGLDSPELPRATEPAVYQATPGAERAPEAARAERVRPERGAQYTQGASSRQRDVAADNRNSANQRPDAALESTVIARLARMAGNVRPPSGGSQARAPPPAAPSIVVGPATTNVTGPARPRRARLADPPRRQRRRGRREAEGLPDVRRCATRPSSRSARATPTELNEAEERPSATSSSARRSARRTRSSASSARAAWAASTRRATRASAASASRSRCCTPSTRGSPRCSRASSARPRRPRRSSSPYVVDVYDVDRTADGRPFMVGEFLEGKEFAELPRRGRQDAGRPPRCASCGRSARRSRRRTRRASSTAT